MRLPRLSLSKLVSDKGSAVSEFVMVVIPITLLVLPLLDLFGLIQEVVVKEQVAYEIARYAALADVSAAEADRFGKASEPTSVLERTSVLSDCNVQASIPVSRTITFWPYPIELIVKALVHCETP
jgi:Flp pilus assembly protein TadG